MEKAIRGLCPRMRAINSPLGQHPKTPRVFGVADRRIQAAANYFHSLLARLGNRRQPGKPGGFGGLWATSGNGIESKRRRGR